MYVGFLISGLNMLVMMLFFNIFLGSYMVFQVRYNYSLSLPCLSRCMFYTLYVAWLFPHVEPSCRVHTHVHSTVVGKRHIHTHVVQVHIHFIVHLRSKCHHTIRTDVMIHKQSGLFSRFLGLFLGPSDCLNPVFPLMLLPRPLRLSKSRISIDASS